MSQIKREQLIDIVMDTLLNIEYKEKDCKEVCEFIYRDIHNHNELFTKEEMFSLGLRYAWLRDSVWHYTKQLI